MAGFDKDTYCSFCYMPGAKHEGGAQVNGQQVRGIFCSKDCFDKWLRWKSAMITSMCAASTAPEEDRSAEAHHP